MPKPDDSSEHPGLIARVKPLALGLLAGLLAGVVMLTAMALARLLFHVATPMEMIFDRAFPLITVDFFIASLVKAGGYTPLKLAGIYGALAGQLAAAGAGGIIYAWFVGRCAKTMTTGSEGTGRPWFDPRGWRLVAPGVLGVWVLFLILLRPQLLTNYRGHAPAAATALTAFWMLVFFAVCGVALMGFYGLLTAPRPRSSGGDEKDDAPRNAALTRRRFLAGGLGALSAVALGGMLRRLFTLGTFGYDGTEYLGPDVVKVTPTDKFYQVTKNLVDPDVARDLWRLDLTGHVEMPRVWTFAELTALPAVEQETTLQCVSYRVGGGLISNALWRGVPLPALLAVVRPKPGTVAVLFHAADGYYETFPFAKAVEPTTLVAWEMNGVPLPPRHGFPVRMIVPGIYGERSAQWITRLEFLAEGDPRLKMKRHDVEGVGFYTEQGWGPNIVVPTTSRFDAPGVAGDHFEEPFKVGQPVELRGMAFGGDKGISKVEVSFDEGETWTEAPITAPGTKISWSLWTLPWTPEEADEEATLLVRATDGDGKLQIAEDRGPVPMGATGLHRVKARVEEA